MIEHRCSLCKRGTAEPLYAIEAFKDLVDYFCLACFIKKYGREPKGGDLI